MARLPSTLPAAREASPRRLALPSGQVVVLAFVLVLAGLIAGGLLSLQWPAHSGPPAQSSTREGNPQLVESTIHKLEADQADLKRALADARDRLDKLQAASAQEKAQLGDVTSALDAERLAAGLVPLHGPGVVAVFQDSTTTDIPQNEDPANYILHDYNLRDIVNTLWASGAEAVSINGERILGTSSIYCVGTTIIVNVTRLSPPYAVHAIGDPATLQAGLRHGPQMQAFLTHAEIYDQPVDIRRADSVDVPAYSGPTGFTYARPGDSAETPTPASGPAEP